MSKVESFTLEMPGFEESQRKIWVYLPDSYEQNKHRAYDVLYMFDGHNLFFDEVATYGKSWGIKTYLDKHKIDLVVVGQDCNHTGNLRISEYCPLPSVSVPGWEIDNYQGDKTAAWFVDTLKPEIEKRYRVSKDRKHIGIGGSSMGGLMSDYMAAKYSHVYSKFASISPATEFCYKECLHLIEAADMHPNTRIYRSFGTHEVSTKKEEMKMISSLMNLSNAFTDKGCIVHNRLGLNMKHCEAAWEKLVPEFLKFLYPDLFQKHK